VLPFPTSLLPQEEQILSAAMRERLKSLYKKDCGFPLPLLESAAIDPR